MNPQTAIPEIVLLNGLLLETIKALKELSDKIGARGTPNLDLLHGRAFYLATDFSPKRIAFRTRWLITKVMREHGYSTGEIAAFLGMERSTVYHYMNKYKPWPGELGLLAKLREEF